MAATKQIRKLGDLAINGAAPAFDRPLHVGRPNLPPRDSFLKYVDDIFDRAWVTNNGPLVQQLEVAIADYLNVKHCIAMCNGTIALEIAIRALELKGEVIIPSYTFVATAHALQWQEITPIFADIAPNTHTLDPDAVRRMITPKTTGIVGVHLWGRGCEHQELQAIADEYGLALMYDAAHAFGCSLDGRMIGGFGACEVLSFHATKFFSTFEGGAVVTNDDRLADKMRLMRNFGFVGFDNVIYPGTNGKMVEVCAAMGLANLGRIEETIASNRANYERYRETFADLSGVRLISYDESGKNNYQYVVAELSDDTTHLRDEIVSALHAENILARKYFWPGAHRMQPYRDLYPHAGLLLPNTKRVSDRVIVLPSGTALPLDAAEIIGSVFRMLTA